MARAWEHFCTFPLVVRTVCTQKVRPPGPPEHVACWVGGGGVGTGDGTFVFKSHIGLWLGSKFSVGNEKLSTFSHKERIYLGDKTRISYTSFPFLYGADVYTGQGWQGILFMLKQRLKPKKPILVPIYIVVVVCECVWRTFEHSFEFVLLSCLGSQIHIL